MSVYGNPVLTGGSNIVQSLSVTQNGIYNPPSGVNGYAPVTVNVSGGGSDIIGFELYGAGNGGGTQTFQGMINNRYMSCCFHDNMSSTFSINGVIKSFTKSEAGHGYGMFCGTTIPVSDNTFRGLNSVLADGSIVVTTHNDSGSYLSVVGGWVGYPSGGTIYENVSNTTTNVIELDSAHSKILVFVGASSTNLKDINSITINNVNYNIMNIGTRFDGVYSLYAAMEINENVSTMITVVFPAICFNYVSIIGL